MRRLSLVVGASFLVFFAGLVALSVRHFRQTHERTIGEQLFLLASTVAGDLDAQLRQFSRALQGNLNRLTPQVLSDPRAACAYLADRPTLQALFDDGIALFDAEGRLVCALPAQDAAAWPDPRATKAGAEGIRYSLPFRSPRTQGHPAVAVSAPLLDAGGATAGWLSGRVLLLGESLGAHYADKRIGRQGYFSVVTQERTVLLHRNPERILKGSAPLGVNAAIDRGLAGFDGWMFSRTSAGVDMIAAVKRVPSTNWLVVANYPLAEARAPFDEARVWYALASACGALALLGLLWLTLRRLTRPLVAMTREVQALARGAALARPITAAGDDEVGTLAAAFNRLLDDLRTEAAERGRAEAVARASEERFRLAFKTSPEPLTLSRLDDSTLVAVNDGFCRLHGFTEEQVLGRRTTDLGIWVQPEERERIRARIARRETVRGVEVHARGADGSTRILSFSASHVVLGGVPHLLALSRDVTEERAAAAAHERLTAELRQSEERHRAILRSAPVVQWAIDAEGRFTLSEGSGLELLGLQPGQVVGMSVFDVYKGYEQVLADYRRATLGESFVSTTQLGPATFETHWGPLRDASGAVTGVTGIAIDLTDRRRAEEQLLQAQKMEAVGRLASGIAHDFNNVLTAVLGGTSFLLERKDLGPQVREEVDQIQRAGERAAALVRQLLAFSRKSSFHPVVTDLAAVVAGLEPLIRRAIGEHIQVQTALPADPWLVRVDTTQLDQVLMNLAVNARDAMPKGGTLRIEVQNREGAARREACVLVSDTGVGMTPEVQARLFEPFFTTKERGRGTGLGLSTAFGIVQQAGGHISCESAPGKGTTFTLAFPVADAPAAARGQAPCAALPAGRGQTVLVVEDDDAVRRSTARMVREAGFVAVEAASGEEALRAVGAARVDLVLTDVLMPGMLGPELAERLKGLRPALPVVFVSGYLDQTAHPLPPGAELLAKPFDKAALLGLLGRVLARAHPAPAAPP